MELASLAGPLYSFDEAAIAGAPRESGVYALYFRERLFYVAMAGGRSDSDTIRDRLLGHLRGELQPSSATHCSWELSRYPQARLHEMIRAVLSHSASDRAVERSEA